MYIRGNDGAAEKRSNKTTLKTSQGDRHTDIETDRQTKRLASNHTHIPEFRGLIGRRGDDVVRVGGEYRVPDPPLVLRLE